MKHILAFFVLSAVKIVSHIFYRQESVWLTPHPDKPWDQARIFALLNHTSLYEPLYLANLPFSYLWKLTYKISVPGADVTLKRPIVGLFWKMMMPNISAVSRKSDNTWSKYLESIQKDSIIFIAPEGRMKRPNGLDKFGKPMTVKPGIADIILSVPEGGLILCLSGGLHHIQKPGQHIPRIFKSLRMNFIYLDLAEYRARFQGSAMEKKLLITKDLQRYLETSCPVQKL